MKKQFKLTLVLSTLFFSSLYAQEEASKDIKYTSNNKGKIYIYWGGNRGNFSDSDIRFKGDNYDFTLNDVASKDRPKGYHIDYINPTRLTIPQTNFRLGYFVSDHYNVSVGIDHMKYVAIQNQETSISGTIDLPEDEIGATFNGDFNDTPIILTPEFLQFEHTDGLNYINVEVARVDDISGLLGINNTDIFQLNITEAVGGGVLFPKTNATLLSRERNDQFHVSGYGVSVKGGLNFTFFKHFFIQAELKGGYINMNDIRTTQSSSDSASQSFFFLERVIALGGIFRLF